MKARHFLVFIAPLSSLAAQRLTTTLDVGAIGLRYGDTVSSGGVSLSPALSFAATRSAIDAIGTLSKFASGMSAQGTVAGSAFTPSTRGMSAELSGSAGGSAHEDGATTGQTRGSLRAHFTRNGAGAWAGGGVGTMWDGGAWHGVRELEYGMWANRRSTQALVSVTTAAVDDTIRYVDTQGALSWILRRAELDLTAGVRGGSRLPSTPGQSRAWGGVSAQLPMTPRASLIVAAGSYPLDFTQGYPAGRYVSASLRFSLGQAPRPAATIAPARGVGRFDVRRVSDTQIVIEVQAASARSVELMGDLTTWEAVPMRAFGAGRFSITLPARAGTSQMNIRVDGGAWVAPPGLTVVKDEFGAEVGILVVPGR